MDEVDTWIGKLNDATAAGDVAAGLLALQTLEALEPDTARWPYDRGVLLYESGDEDGALHCYQAALQKDDQHLFSWINLGRILDDRGHWADALAAYDRALSLPRGPTDSIVWSNRGNTLLSLDRFDDAVTSFERSLAIESGTVAVRGLQSALGWAGRAQEANAARPEEGSAHDRGVFHQLERPFRDGRILVRFWVGRHTRPDWLLQSAEQMADHVLGFADTPPGLADGVRIQWGWSSLVLRAYGQDLVVCESTYSSDGLAWDVGFTLQTEIMQGMTHGMVEVAPQPATDRQLVSAVPNSLFEQAVYMRRFHSDDPEHTGWLIAARLADFDGGLRREGLEVYRCGGLVRIRHPLIKPLTLPTGWTVRFDGHAIESITDEKSEERWDL